MDVKVKMDYAPIHEVLLSFLLFKRTQNLKYLHVGKDWEKNTKSLISKKLLNAFDQLHDLSFFDLSMLFVEDCPDSNTVEGFLDWLQSVSVGYMYERVQPFLIPHEHSVPFDFGKERDRYVQLMKAWYAEYFSTIESNILDELSHHAQEQSKKILNMSAETLIDTLSNGWYKIDTSDIKTVHFIPQFHLRPFTTMGLFQKYMIISYPMQIQSSQSTILNIAKALSDPIRLDIIRLLSSGMYSFTEIIKNINSTKGNIHHHLMILRSCGLLRLHISEGYVVSQYSIRPYFMDILNTSIHEWLNHSSLDTSIGITN